MIYGTYIVRSVTTHAVIGQYTAPSPDMAIQLSRVDWFAPSELTAEYLCTVQTIDHTTLSDIVHMAPSGAILTLTAGELHVTYRDQTTVIGVLSRAVRDSSHPWPATTGWAEVRDHTLTILHNFFAQDEWLSYIEDSWLEYRDTMIWLSHRSDDAPCIHPSDLSSDIEQTMRVDLENFLNENRELLVSINCPPGIGHHFALSRNRHGTGLWDMGLGDVGQKLHQSAVIYGTQELNIDAQAIWLSN